MKKIYSILIIVTALLVSCSEDFLDRSSLTELANDTFWSSEADAKMAIAGCYDALQDNYIFNGGPWQGSIAGRWDYMSDNGWVRWGWMAGGDISRGEQSSSSWIIGDFWNSSYRVIGRANLIIQQVPLMSEDLISAEVASAIVAEAKFLRAFMYNYLTMTYEDVPLVLTVQDPADANLAKSSKEDVVAFIIQDLEAAIDDLPSKGETEWGRATKGAGYALLARINLFNENWGAAIIAADKVIGYSLHQDYQKLFKAENELSDEVIFSVRFLRGPEETGAQFAAYWGPQKGVTYQEVLPNLANDFFCTDGQPISDSPLYNSAIPSENRDARFDGTIVSKGSLFNGIPADMGKFKTKFGQRKYTDEGTDGDNGENHFDSDEDFYVFRLGHVILIKAEALAESGGSSSEIFGLINQLRPRANMPDMDQAEVDNYFGGDIVEAVRHERRVETAFEGLRYLDIKRWGIMQERVDYYMNNDKVEMGFLSIRYFAPQNYVWPLPQSELDVNTNLVQHELW